jgi:hypothetical protein
MLRDEVVGHGLLAQLHHLYRPISFYMVCNHAASLAVQRFAHPRLKDFQNAHARRLRLCIFALRKSRE